MKSEPTEVAHTKRIFNILFLTFLEDEWTDGRTDGPTHGLLQFTEIASGMGRGEWC